MSIINLQEISPNSWKALYQGNYGVYTIKIKTDGNKTIDFSCSCPSDYYPCKHIPMIEKAIKQSIAKNMKNDNEQNITPEQLLKNAILLEFAFDYTLLLRNVLEEFNYEDEYEDRWDDCIEIDELGQWLDKVQEYVDMDNPNEAILICKACIEEYASWCDSQDVEIEVFDISYQEKPFEILDQILDMPGTEYEKLFDYCKSEMLKPKYKDMEMYNGFNGLFMKLSTMKPRGSVRGGFLNHNY